MTAKPYARTVMERADVLGSYSEEPGCLTRRFATPAMRQANEAVAAWMREAGMRVQQDHVGNIRGHYAATSKDAPTLLLGSHIDTVRDAGKYDGPLGVLVAIACIQRLHDRQQRLPFALQVFAFADEEGLRYNAAYFGSQVVAGTFDPADLRRVDVDGIPLADAIRAFGGDPDALEVDKWQGGPVLGYCEVHIEQGPVLEARNLPVGMVSAIAGQSRFNVTFSGEAGHAGTVPMEMRRDALCAAAEFTLAVEAMGRDTPDLVATVGQVTLHPNASNVIPGEVKLSLDVRHQNDAVRETINRQLQARARQIGQQRQVSTGWTVVRENAAVPCAPHLTRWFAQAMEDLGYPVLALPSGAGHDAVAMADLTDIAMLFVRCAGGISHHPAEAVTTADVAVAIDVLDRFLQRLAEQNT